MKTLVIQPDGTETTKIHSRELTLSELQGLVGGYIELIAIREHQGQMFVNEEGRLKGMLHNSRASGLSSNGHTIVGPAVVPVDWRVE
jgi:hypothetical protein